MTPIHDFPRFSGFWIYCTGFFYISSTFINTTRLKLAKNQVKAKQYSEAELLLFENYLLSSSTLSSKNNRAYFKKCTKNQACLFVYCIWKICLLIIMKVKKNNGSHRYSINRATSRHGLTYTKYQKCLSIMMLTCIKQHPTNTLKLNLWKN